MFAKFECSFVGSRQQFTHRGRRRNGTVEFRVCGEVHLSVFDVCEVSDVRSLSLVERPCSGSSMTSAKISPDDDHVDETEYQRAGDVLQSTSVSSEDVVNDDDDDVGRGRRVVFPVKPAEHSAAGSCPASPPSDEMTRAEDRTCDGQEQEHSETDQSVTRHNTGAQ